MSETARGSKTIDTGADQDDGGALSRVVQVSGWAGQRVMNGVLGVHGERGEGETGGVQHIKYIRREIRGRSRGGGDHSGESGQHTAPWHVSRTNHIRGSVDGWGQV